MPNLNPNKELDPILIKCFDRFDADGMFDPDDLGFEEFIEAREKIESLITQSQHTAVREFVRDIKKSKGWLSYFDPATEYVPVKVIDRRLSEYLEVKR